MDKESYFRFLEEVYYSAPCNEYYKPKITVGDGRAEIVIKTRKDLFHALGAVHSSAYYKALDDAAIFSAQSALTDEHALTSNFNMFISRPVSSGELKAVGRVVNSTRSRIIAESVLYDSSENELARGIGSFVRIKGIPEQTSMK